MIDNKYKYSFSGSDARLFAWFPKAPDTIIPIGTATTLSVSVHEAKGVARALGFKNIKGVSRSSRTIAGSLICTIERDHPLRELMATYSLLTEKGDFDSYADWSVDNYLTGRGAVQNTYAFNNVVAGVLPPVNFLVEYVSEYGYLAFSSTQQRARAEMSAMAILGVEFIDSGIVTSVNDVLTEMTFTFIAEDIKPFSYQAADLANAIRMFDTIPNQDLHNRVLDALSRGRLA